jgi:hypothetical protein
MLRPGYFAGTIMGWLLPEILALLFAFIAFAIALEIGYRIGLRKLPLGDEPMRTHANTLYTAALGLLALLIGFTFAMAVSRFESRKGLMVDQANAIGTASLRASILPADKAARAATLFSEYIQTRFQYNASLSGSDALNAAEARAGNIENELWAMGRAELQADPRSQPASLYLQALNDMFDLREKRRFALDDHVPTAVSVLLFGVSVVALALIAYSCGLSGRRRLPANLTFAFLIALVFIIIMDIDRPRQGLVRVSDASLVRLQQSLPAPPK